MSNGDKRRQCFQTDWITSRPVFYNEATGAVSFNIHDVIDYPNMELDPEGFNDYLDFGYSVFGRTPVRDVRILRHSSRAWSRSGGPPDIVNLDDPAEPWAGATTDEDDVIDRMRSRVQAWEEEQIGDIIVPTSGGYDSRLLNWLIRDKSRIRAFTFGLSKRQDVSFESVYAQRVCRLLGIRWDRITLGGQHSYLQEWERLYGASVHSHGMYQIEFFDTIKQHMPTGSALLSGIFGDVWAGNVAPTTVRNPSEINRLGYTHNLHADSRYSRLSSTGEARERFWEEIRDYINDPFWQIVTVIRMKIILISYLLSIPTWAGFRPWSPFLDIDVALGMLCLPKARWTNRRWQRDLFVKEGLDVESLRLQADHGNELIAHALRFQPLPSLNVELLREIIDPAYVEWINRNTRFTHFASRWSHRLQATPLAGKTLRRFGVGDRLYRAYFAHLTLWPIQRLLERRQEARRT